jgi:thiol-disulfide isomerase/thioredoxin
MRNLLLFALLLCTSFVVAQDAPIPKVGGKAPLFAIQSLEYNNFVMAEKIQELKAKKGLLVLDFWATWCKPCMRELPEFERIHKELSAKGVQFFAVAIDDKRQDIWRYVKTEKKYTFPVLVDLNAFNAGRKYGADKTLPQLFVIDSEGIIRFHHTGEIKNVEAAVKGILESIQPGLFPEYKGKAIDKGETSSH